MKFCIFCNEPFSSIDWLCPKCGKSPDKKGGHYSFISDSIKGSGGFPLESFPLLAENESTYFWFRARNQLIIWAIKKYFPSIKNFFEIGYGTGYVLSGIASQLPDLNLSGSDFHVEGLHFAISRLKNDSLFQMDARSIPFFDEFDLIGAFDVLEHIEEDEKSS